MSLGDARASRFCLHKNRFTAANWLSAWLSPPTTATLLCVTLAAGFLRLASFSASRCLGVRSLKRWQLPSWQRMLAPSDDSRDRTLPGRQRWMLAPWDASRNRTLRGWQPWMFAPSDAFRDRTLPGWLRWMLAPGDAFRNRTLPGWQRWMLTPSDASRNRTLPGWQRWMLTPLDASRNRTLPLAG